MRHETVWDDEDDVQDLGRLMIQASELKSEVMEFNPATSLSQEDRETVRLAIHHAARAYFLLRGLALAADLSLKAARQAQHAMEEEEEEDVNRRADERDDDGGATT